MVPRHQPQCNETTAPNSDPDASNSAMIPPRQKNFSGCTLSGVNSPDTNSGGNIATVRMSWTSTAHRSGYASSWMETRMTLPKQRLTTEQRIHICKCITSRFSVSQTRRFMQMSKESLREFDTNGEVLTRSKQDQCDGQGGKVTRFMTPSINPLLLLASPQEHQFSCFYEASCSQLVKIDSACLSRGIPRNLVRSRVFRFIHQRCDFAAQEVVHSQR